MKILQGNCLDILKTLESNSVQCVITSPPYWGLRDYKTEPQIFGGEKDKNCQHDWQRGYGGLLHENRNNQTGSQDEVAAKKMPTSHIFKYDRIGSSICTKCGAWKGCLGLEPVPELYVQHLVQIFREIKRVLKEDGTVWLNLGDSYVSASSRHSSSIQTISPMHNPRGALMDGNKPDLKGHPILKEKDLAGIPWRTAFALQEDGWYLRSDIIWAKRDAMPESVKDRPTKSHEYIFMLSKNKNYYYDYKAMLEPADYNGRKSDAMVKKGVRYKGVEGMEHLARAHERWPSKTNGIPARNKRDVWWVSTTRCKKGKHYAVYPTKLIEPCVLAGSKKGDIILDPFNGSGTTGVVALQHGRDYIGIELNPDYIKLTKERLKELEIKLL